MTLISVISLTALYFINKYWYPPEIKFNTSDFIKKAVLSTNYGNITMSMRTDSKLAAAQFTRLVKSGFYNGTRIHRIVPDLLIEGGDPLTKYESEKTFWGQGGLTNAFKNETHNYDRMTAGTVAMSGSGNGTFGSQFIILTKDTPWLKGKHTIIGNVVSGMDIVKKIESLPHDATGMPIDNVIVYKIDYL